MGIAEVGELINTVGFPIAAFIAMFWLNRETLRRYEKVLSEFESTIKTHTEVIRDLAYNQRNRDDV